MKIADVYAALSVNGVTQFDKGMDTAEKRARAAADAVQKLGQAMLVMGVAITAAATLAVREAAQFETLEVRLQAIFNSTTKGTEAFKELQKVAAKTPFSLQGVVTAGATLAAYMGRQKDQAVALTVSIADLAAFMGDDIPQAASAFGRAFAAGAGAADMLRERGVLALVADFARMKHGIEDLTKLTLPAFRKILVEAIQDPMLGIAGSTERLSKTLAGAMSNMKDALSQLSAAFGKELLPEIRDFVVVLTDTLTWLNEISPALKAIIVWTASLGGAITGVVGGLIVLIPKLSTLQAVFFAIRGIVAGIGTAGTGGLIGAFIALAAVMNSVDVASRGAGQAARDLAAGGGKDLEARLKTTTDRMGELSEAGREDWHEFAVLSATAKDLNHQLDALAQFQTAAVVSTADAVAAASGGVREFNQLAFDTAQTWQMTLDRLNQQWHDLALGIQPETPVGDVWKPRSLEVDEKVKKTINWLGALQQAAGAAGQSLGTMFKDMAEGAEVNLEKVIVSIVKLIAKLLIMAALYAIPGVGPILSQFAGGIMGGMGFDNPVSDTQAFRWGMDFTRQFGAGVNSMLGNGLGLPQMQPATVGGMGNVGFDVHVHNATPDTYVQIVRKGVKAMGSADRLGLMRDNLGRAYDDWNGR